MEQKIDEMAKVLKDYTKDKGIMASHVILDDYAEALYNAGYRKQTEGEWIDRYKGEFVNPIYICSICEKGTLLKPQIDVLGNMEMVQALSAFCPNCGAHMRGGAE